MGNPRDVVIVNGVRTPCVKAGTKFNEVHVTELGKVAVKGLIARTNLDVNIIDEVIMGNTGTPADASNVSRVITLNAGFPLKTPAYTTHRNCAASMTAISNAHDHIKAGSADAIVAGGAESMSNLRCSFQKILRTSSESSLSRKP